MASLRLPKDILQRGDRFSRNKLVAFPREMGGRDTCNVGLIEQFENQFSDPFERTASFANIQETFFVDKITQHLFADRIIEQVKAMPDYKCKMFLNLFLISGQQGICSQRFFNEFFSEIEKADIEKIMKLPLVACIALPKSDLESHSLRRYNDFARATFSISDQLLLYKDALIDIVMSNYPNSERVRKKIEGWVRALEAASSPKVPEKPQTTVSGSNRQPS